MSTQTDDSIRRQVAEAYGSRVRPVLDADDLSIPLVASSDCCAPSSAASSSCCGVEGTDDVQITRIAEMYQGAEIADLPATVTDVAFGCGNPTAIAAMKPGETVLDLGSGGGIDCFLAAKMVGPSGKVIGVDMSSPMKPIECASSTRTIAPFAFDTATISLSGATSPIIE